MISPSLVKSGQYRPSYPKLQSSPLQTGLHSTLAAILGFIFFGEGFGRESKADQSAATVERGEGGYGGEGRDWKTGFFQALYTLRVQEILNSGDGWERDSTYNSSQ